MKQLADGVWQLSGFPPNAINVFVIEDVLIDASTRYATRRILRQVDGHDDLRARAHPRPPRPPGREPQRLRAPRDPVLGRRGRRRRGREPRADRRAPARPLHGPALRSRRAPAPGTRSTASWSRATRSAGFESSTFPGTPPATSPSGASPTASWSPATSSTPPTRSPRSPDCASRSGTSPRIRLEPPLGQAPRRARAEPRSYSATARRIATRASSSSSARALPG